MQPDHQTQHQLLETIGLLYEAASDQQQWAAFLRATRTLFNAQFANFLHLDKRHPELSVSILSGFEHHPIEAQQEGARKQVELADEDPRMLYARAHPNMPFRCTDVMPVAEFQATRIYRELLQPAGIEFSLSVQFSDEQELFTGLSLHRTPSLPAFSVEERDMLGELIPHLRRTLDLQRRLAAAHEQSDSLAGVLNSLLIGVIVVDAEGVVDFINDEARKLLSLSHCGLTVRNSSLAIQPLLGVELPSVLRAVAESGGHQLLNTAKGIGTGPIHCLVTRLPTGNTPGYTNLLKKAKLAVYLSDPSKPLETADQLLQRLFGLTIAESRVLEKLVAGLSPEEIADHHGVGIATVRTQLKALFAKTDTTRQSELVAKVLNNRLWHAMQPI